MTPLSKQDWGRLNTGPVGPQTKKRSREIDELIEKYSDDPDALADLKIFDARSGYAENYFSLFNLLLKAEKQNNKEEIARLKEELHQIEVSENERRRG